METEFFREPDFGELRILSTKFCIAKVLVIKIYITKFFVNFFQDEELEEVRQNCQKKMKVLEQQLESEHEERINFVKHKHDLVIPKS